MVFIFQYQVTPDHTSKNTLFNNTRIITAYSVHPNLGKILANTKPRAHSKSSAGCTKCASTRCKACNFITESKNFTSRTTQETYSVPEHISCTSKNVVYLITCKLCGLQYVGETGRMLKERINDHHLSAIRLQKETPIGIHPTYLRILLHTSKTQYICIVHYIQVKVLRL
jgi:GIY-YIG catalytic domain